MQQQLLILILLQMTNWNRWLCPIFFLDKIASTSSVMMPLKPRFVFSKVSLLHFSLKPALFYKLLAGWQYQKVGHFSLYFLQHLLSRRRFLFLPSFLYTIFEQPAGIIQFIIFHYFQIAMSFRSLISSRQQRGRQTD